jgi:hypothetical protein
MYEATNTDVAVPSSIENPRDGVTVVMLLPIVMMTR